MIVYIFLLCISVLGWNLFASNACATDKQPLTVNSDSLDDEDDEEDDGEDPFDGDLAQSSPGPKAPSSSTSSTPEFNSLSGPLNSDPQSPSVDGMPSAGSNASYPGVGTGTNLSNEPNSYENPSTSRPMKNDFARKNPEDPMLRPMPQNNNSAMPYSSMDSNNLFSPSSTSGGSFPRSDFDQNASSHEFGPASGPISSGSFPDAPYSSPPPNIPSYTSSPYESISSGPSYGSASSNPAYVNSPEAPDYGPDYSGKSSLSYGATDTGTNNYGMNIPSTAYGPKSTMDQGNFSWGNLDLHSLISSGSASRGY